MVPIEQRFAMTAGRVVGPIMVGVGWGRCLSVHGLARDFNRLFKLWIGGIFGLDLYWVGRVLNEAGSC